LFVIDENGVIVWSYRSPMAVNPGGDGILGSAGRTGCLMEISLMAVLKVPVNSSDHVQGPDDAPLTLLEYGDYECPYCGLAYPIIKRVQRHFGEV